MISHEQQSEALSRVDLLDGQVLIPYCIPESFQISCILDL